jgi:hypothetical protein
VFIDAVLDFHLLSLTAPHQAKHQSIRPVKVAVAVEVVDGIIATSVRLKAFQNVVKVFDSRPRRLCSRMKLGGRLLLRILGAG